MVLQGPLTVVSHRLCLSTLGGGTLLLSLLTSAIKGEKNACPSYYTT